MKLTGIVTGLKFALKYAAVIVVIVQIIEFAIEKLEAVKLPERTKTTESNDEVN